MAHEFKARRIVEFAETDMAGILHFSNYFRYMESVEHEFFRSLGMRVHALDGDAGAWGWARRTVACTYLRPLRYEDEVELHLLVHDKRTRALGYTVIFRKLPERSEVARGSMVAVCVVRGPGGDLRAVPMPAEVDARIEVAPAGLLD